MTEQLRDNLQFMTNVDTDKVGKQFPTALRDSCRGKINASSSSSLLAYLTSLTMAAEGQRPRAAKAHTTSPLST